MNRKRIAAALLCGAALVAGAEAKAQSLYSSLTVFGDSLSDPGNIPKFFGLNYPPAPYFENQFSNGPIYAKSLGGLIGIETPLTDYAIGGAMTGSGNIGGLPGNPKIGLPNAGIDGELTYYLAGNPHPTSRDLFIVWGGANDYFSELPAIIAKGLDPTQLRASLLTSNGAVTQTVSNLVADINRLAKIGVRNFVVPNLPDLGATPSYNGSQSTSQTATIVADTHNKALAAAMADLQRQLHVNITIVDTSAAFHDLVTNPGRYGLDPAHLTDECKLSPSCVANHTPYLFWDEVHPTGQVQNDLALLFAASLEGPTTVAPQMEMGRMVQQSLFDHISARAASIRSGVTGLVLDGSAGSAALSGDDKPLAAFLTDSYGWGSRERTAESAGFDYHSNTLSAGADYRINDWVAVGALAGFTQTDGTLGGDLGRQSVDSYQFAAYATAYASGWYAAAAGTYAYDDWHRLDRNVFLGGQTVHAATNGHTFGAALQGGYLMHSGGWSFGPEVEFRLADFRIGGYAEHGAAAVPQIVEGQGLTSMVGQFGFEAAYQTSLGGYVVVPHVRAAFDHEFHGNSRAIVTRIASQPTSVTTDLPVGSTDWGRLGAGVDIHLTDMFSALVDFDSAVGRDGGEDYSALARLKARF